jgi:hypothetical protein
MNAPATDKPIMKSTSRASGDFADSDMIKKNLPGQTTGAAVNLYPVGTDGLICPLEHECRYVSFLV